MGEGVGSTLVFMELGGALETRALLWGFCHCGRRHNAFVSSPMGEYFG